MRKAAAVLAGALALAGCTSSTASVRIGPGPARASTIPTTSENEGRAVAFLRDHADDGTLRHRWQRLVVLTKAVTGDEEHLRWTARVVYPNGHIGIVTSELGDTTTLDMLVQPGDYLWVHIRFGTLSHRDVIVKGHDAAGSER